MVFSREAYKREIITFEKKLEKEKEAIENALWHLSNEEFACEPDAQKKIKELAKLFDWHEVAAKIITEKKFSCKGRPKKDQEPDRIVFKIQAVASRKEENIAKMKERKGRFILATNYPDEAELPDETILSEYKDLQINERGFKMLKDPWFLADKLFLKNPNRIAALMAVMTFCLFVYNSGEYMLRESLNQNNLTLPNQLKKEVQNPTLRWVFQMMEGTTIVSYSVSGDTKSEVANMTPLKNRIVSHFGEIAKEIYGTS